MKIDVKTAARVDVWIDDNVYITWPSEIGPGLWDVRERRPVRQGSRYEGSGAFAESKRAAEILAQCKVTR